MHAIEMFNRYNLTAQDDFFSHILLLLLLLSCYHHHQAENAIDMQQSYIVALEGQVAAGGGGAGFGGGGSGEGGENEGAAVVALQSKMAGIVAELSEEREEVTRSGNEVEKLTALLKEKVRLLVVVLVEVVVMLVAVVSVGEWWLDGRQVFQWRVCFDYLLACLLAYFLGQANVMPFHVISLAIVSVLLFTGAFGPRSRRTLA
jgi:hypothetical protein